MLRPFQLVVRHLPLHGLSVPLLGRRLGLLLMMSLLCHTTRRAVYRVIVRTTRILPTSSTNYAH